MPFRRLIPPTPTPGPTEKRQRRHHSKRTKRSIRLPPRGTHDGSLGLVASYHLTQKKPHPFSDRPLTKLIIKLAKSTRAVHRKHDMHPSTRNYFADPTWVVPVANWWFAGHRHRTAALQSVRARTRKGRFYVIHCLSRSKKISRCFIALSLMCKV